MSNGKTLAKTAALLMVAMLLSRVLGYVREAVLASSFGATWQTDAFWAAFTIPDFLYDLLVGGVLSSAFIPVFSSYLAKDKEEEAWEVARTIINLTVIVMAVCITLGMIFTVPLTKLVAYKFSGQTLALSVKLTRIMLPAFIILSLNGLIQGVLNSYKHFTAPAIGAVAYNFCIIAFGLALSRQYGIMAFAIGVVAGHITNFLIEPPMLFKKVVKYYRPTINLKHPGVRKMLTLMLPAMLGLAANRLNLIVNQNFASGISAGSITALGIANRLMWLPLGVFAGSIAVAIFPTMTAQAAKKEINDFKHTVSMGVRSILLITIPASVGLSVLSIPIVRLLFQHNNFTAHATKVTAYALIFYCIGLFAQSAIWVVVRAFYALQDTFRPLLIAISTIIINVILNFTLRPIMAERGLALAYSLTGIYNLLMLFLVLRTKVGPLGLKKIGKSFVLITISSVLMGIATYSVSSYLGTHLDMSASLNRVIQVVVSVIIGLAVFVAAILRCHLDETELIMGIVRRKLKRRVKTES